MWSSALTMLQTAGNYGFVRSDSFVSHSVVCEQ